MRLEIVLDPLVVFGAVLGSGGPQVCPVRFAAALGQPVVREADVTAFVDVNVVPMDAERVLRNHTVIVTGTRITALGPSGQVPVPAGAVRIDGRGKYLLPGLADMHNHVNFPEPAVADAHLRGLKANDRMYRLLNFPSYGITTIRRVGTGGTP